MRLLSAFLAAWAFGWGSSVHAASDAELKDFAQRYALAVESRDVTKIKALFLPELFVDLSPSGKQTVERWDQSFKTGLLPANDPVWITVKTLPPNPPFLFTGNWKAKPQYTIQIESHHSANGGEESHDALLEAVVEKDSHLYIIRPLPD